MHNVYEPSISRYEKRKRWQQVVSAWQASDLTAKEFCRVEHIKIADLRRWSYRLKRQLAVLKNTKKTSTTPAFIPITLSQPAPNKHSVKDSTVEDSTIDIVLGKNLLLRIQKKFDANLLLHLIQILREIEAC